jgi:hypothetical protein
MKDRGFDNDMLLAIVEELGLQRTLEELAVVCGRMAEYAAETEDNAAHQAWTVDEQAIRVILPAINNRPAAEDGPEQEQGKQ